jgi:hypothetical protein
VTPDQRADHLKLCRDVYEQLQQFQSGQNHSISTGDKPLPFNLAILLAHFDRYIKWTNRRANVIEIGSSKSAFRVGEDGNSA